MEVEEDVEIEDFLSRSKHSLRDMMDTDGWHLFRKMLLTERNDQVLKLIGLLPVAENLPAYASAKSKISLIDQLLTAQPSDIAEYLYNERNNRS